MPAGKAVVVLNDDEHEDEPEAEDKDELAPEDMPSEPGAEGGSKSPAADRLPALPARDDAPLGDTDQHSTG